MKLFHSLALACAALLLPAVAQAAQLTYDVRLDAATSSPGVIVAGPHSAIVSGPGDVVGVQIYAVVNGANDTHEDDGFIVGIGSFVSTGGLPGDLRGDVAGGGWTQVNNVAPFNGFVAQSGFQADLDSDGDLDVGSNLTISPVVLPWFVAASNAGSGTAPILGSGSGPGPTEFLIGQTIFTVGAGAQAGQGTTVHFNPRVRTDGGVVGNKVHKFTRDGVAISLLGSSVEIATVSASIQVAGILVPQAPVAITQEATNVTPTTATLNGMVNPNGGLSTAKFQYGLTTDYGTEVPLQLLPGDGDAPQALNAPLAGLVANTTYHYRITATNSVGTTNGDDRTFTTPAGLLPTFDLLDSTVIGATSAIITGKVNPRGSPTTAVLQSGLTTAYGTTTPVTPAPGSGNNPVPVSVTLTGLTPGKAYHCRLSATNLAGTASGTDFVLNTLPAPTVATMEAKNIGATSATLTARVNPQGFACTAKFQSGLTISSLIDTPVVLSPANGTEMQEVSTTLTGLTPNTTYVFRISGTSAFGTQTGGPLHFTTAPGPTPLPPSAVTGTAAPIGATSAVLNAEVNPTGLASTAKFQFGLTTAYGTETPVILSPVDGTAVQAVTAAMNGLTPNTTYHFRISATNSAGTTEGADGTFTTQAALNAKLTYEMRIDSATSSPGVTVTDAHHAVASAAGDVVGVQIYAVVNGANDTHQDDGLTLAEGSFVSTGGLPGDLRGDVTGQPATLVNNVAPFDILGTQSGFQADLDGDGDLDVGSNLTTGPAPVPWFVALSNAASGTAPILGSGSGPGPTEFLIGRTTFTVRAGAQAGQGTTVHFNPRIRTDGGVVARRVHKLTLDGVAFALEGSDPNIATVSAEIVLAAPVQQPPAVTTGGFTDKGPVQATLSATVNPNGNATTAKFQLGLTASAYDIEISVTLSPGNGVVAQTVSAQATGLTPLTTYHYRIVATNSAGTAEGEDKTFTTIQPLPPVVINYGVKNGATSVTLSGLVVPRGLPTTAVFQWGETAEYGTDAVVNPAPGSGLGGVPVSVALTGLTPGKTYHYRLSATNLAGTATSTDFFFVTTPAPTLTLLAATNIDATSATLNAKVNPQGYPCTAKFQYGLTSALLDTEIPVVLSPADGTVAQNVSTTLTGLTPNTTYYFRISGTSAFGTQTATLLSFITAPGSNPLPPGAVTGTAAPIGTTSAVLNAAVNPTGLASTAKFQYGLTTAYGTETPVILSPVDGTAVQAVSVAINGLTPNTTYHFRISATNSAGTTEGADGTFTTQAALNAKLTYEMRIDSTTSSPGVTVTDAHHAVASTAGDVVGVQIYAVVNGANDTHEDDGFILAEGSFVSTGGLPGDLRGDVTGQPATLVNNVAPFDILGTQSGFQADLDGDGDLDVGSNSTSAPLVVPWFVALSNAGSGTAPILGSGSGPGPTEFLIGRTTFTVGAGAQAGQGTTVHFNPRIRTDGPFVAKRVHKLTLDGVVFALEGSDPNIATVSANITLAGPAQPPVAVTGAALDVGATKATLHATVNPNGAATTARFQSGLTDAYGTDTAVVLAPNDGTSAQGVSTTLTGLIPNTTYHFRISATNSAGPSDGADVTFTTLADAIPPTIAAPDGGFLPLTLTTGGEGTAGLPDYTGQAVTGDNIGVTAVTQIPAPGAVNAGIVHVVLTAHDAAENTADTAFDVTVLDGTAPVITHAPDSIGSIADAAGQAPVPDVTGGVTATDNVGVTSIVQAPPAGASAGVGQVDIVVTVADAAGNTATASVTFTVLAHVEPPTDRGRGYYSGLLDNGVGRADGLVTLLVNAGGAFSGKVSLQGMTKGFQGRFHGDIALVNIPGFGYLALTRSGDEGIDLALSGFTGHAENTPYTQFAPASMRGSYTLLLPPDPAHAGDMAFPQGTGFATLKVTVSGLARCVGRMGDGVPFAFESAVHGDGTLPCYDGLYTAPRGSVAGTLTFRDLAGSDLDGTLAWNKPPPVGGARIFRFAYPDGFGDLDVSAIGSFYRAPATPQRMLTYNAAHSATMTFHDGGLPAPLSSTVIVRAAPLAFVSAPVRTLILAPGDGTFMGMLRPVGKEAAQPFFGVVFQKQNRGAGLFMGTTAAGGIDYTPLP